MPVRCKAAGSSRQVPKPTLIGISGCTRSGKGTLAHGLVEKFGEAKTVVICQDRFVSGRLAAQQASGWEATESIDHAAFRSKVLEASRSTHACVIVEGFRAFHDWAVVDLLHYVLWLDVSRETCFARRMVTAPVPEHVFSNHLWPRHDEYAAACLRGGGPVALRGSILNGEAEPKAVLRAALSVIQAGTRRDTRAGPTAQQQVHEETAAAAEAAEAAEEEEEEEAARTPLRQHASGSPIGKLLEALSVLEPGAKVGVVTLLGSLCPITRGHVQAFVEARRLLLGEACAVHRPTCLEPFDAVVGLISLNDAGYVDRKLRGKGEASLSKADRLALVKLAVEEHAWIAWEERESDTLLSLESTLPHLSFAHFQMNGADDVLRHRKYAWAGPGVRMITMGRPGDTEAVVQGALRAGVDLDEGTFIMGPELPDISSSDARRALAKGDFEAAAQHLHPSVLAWCRERGCWRSLGKGPLPRAR